jgi:hypothetical protein
MRTRAYFIFVRAEEEAKAHMSSDSHSQGLDDKDVSPSHKAILGYLNSKRFQHGLTILYALSVIVDYGSSTRGQSRRRGD